MSIPLDLFPETARVTLDNHLAIGGVDLVDLAARHGTPLYVYDSATVVARAGAAREALRASYPGTTTVCYAATAYVAPWLLKLLAPEGLGLAVASGAELHVGERARFPMDRVYVHGMDKGEAELRDALERRVGRVVVDNLDEIALLARLAAARGGVQPVMLELGPGTSGLDISSGAAEAGVRAILAEAALDLRGFHADADPDGEIDRVFAFAAQVREKTGFVLREVGLGGEDAWVGSTEGLTTLAAAVLLSSTRHGIDQPELTIDVGRSIVAPAGVAVSRVGAVKKGARTTVIVDGDVVADSGAVLASRVEDGGLTDVAIAGRDDALIEKVTLPYPHVGDLIAVPVSGAHAASRVPLAPRPAVVVVADGDATVVRSRDTYDDLLTRDVF